MSWIQDLLPLQLIWIESSFCLSIFILILFSLIFGRRRSKILIYIVVFAWLIFISQRSVDYNSDTTNYYAYFSNMAGVGIVDMFLMKLEPLHFLLANMASSFNDWLLLESLLMFLLLVKLLKNKSMVMVALVLGATLPLMSSSFRFALGLTFSLWFYDYLSRKSVGYWLLAPIGALGHISMGVAPFLIRLSKLSLLLPIVFLFAVSMFPELGDRVIGTGGIGTLSGWVGVKTLGVFFLLYLFYLKYTVNFPTKHTGWFHEYAILMIILFFAANLIFGMANRWMIFVLLIFAIRASQLPLAYRNNSYKNVIPSAFFFSILSFPQWGMLIANGGWYE